MKKQEEFTPIYNAILDIDINSETFTGTFVGVKKADEVFKIIKSISNAISADHKENCSNKDDRCPGILSYMIPHLKMHLTAHPEYDVPTVLAILAGMYLEIGRRDMEANMIRRKVESKSMESLLKLFKRLDKRDNVEVNVVDLTDKENQ